MIKEKIISGSGGGGKGKGGGSESANTLRSRATARLVEVLSEGEIEGLVNGAQSIFFDQTPVKNENNTRNFKGVKFEQRFGLPDQDHVTGIPYVETPFDVNVEVKKNVGPVVRTITEANADAVRVTIQLPSLVRQDKKDGSLKATNVSYAIELRPFNGTWTRVVEQDFVNEKTTSAYQVAHRIPLPMGGNPWDIRVVRITDDSEEAELQNKTFWESYTVLTEGKFTYPNTAFVFLEVDAEQMGQNIPQRTYHVRGLKIKVPVNYNPLRRLYNGVWNGTFKTAWTNNPAWILYDILTNNRYGLGEYIGANNIDKWSFYQIGQYCDQLVPSGYKDASNNDIMEPRYTFNGVISNREEAYKVVQQIATSFRGMLYWATGAVFPIADQPSDPTKLVAPADVIDGAFNYSGTGLKARHSVALVTWNDPMDHYRPAVEVVINDKMLQKIGWRETEFEALGCTSRSLAHRFGKWVLDVEEHETETIEYTASLDHLDLRPGDIIAVADPKKAEIRIGGRLIRVDSPDNQNMALDGSFEPIDGQTYSLMMELPDGKVESRSIIPWPGAVDNTGNKNLIGLYGYKTNIITSSALTPPEFPPWATIQIGLSSIQRQVVNTGVDSLGREFIDFRFWGTNDAANRSIIWRPLGVSGYRLNDSINQVYNFTGSIARIAGKLDGIESNRISIRLDRLDSTQTTIQSSVSQNIDNLTSSEISFNNSLTVNSTNTTSVSPLIFMDIAPNAVIDVTLRIINPSLKIGSAFDYYIPTIKPSIFRVASPYSQNPKPNAMWVITGSDIQPRQYRVLGISETEKNQFKVAALFHDPDKYARIEHGIVFEPRRYKRPSRVIEPPTNLSIDEFQYISGGFPRSNLTLSWSPPIDRAAVKYHVTVDTPSGLKDLGETNRVSIDLENIDVGAHTFYVRSVGRTGLYSSSAELTYTTTSWSGTSGPTVSNLEIRNRPGVTLFSGRNVEISWINNLSASNNALEANIIGESNPFYRDNVIRVFDNANNELLRTENIRGSTYLYTFESNTADNAPFSRPAARNLRFEVSVRDTLERQSAFQTLTINNPVPNSITPAITTAPGALNIACPSPSDVDFAGYRVWVSTTNNFNPLSTEPFYDGPNNSCVFFGTLGTTYYIRAAAYDSFGKTGLNISAQQTATISFSTFDTEPPPVPTGLALSSEIEAIGSGQTRCLLTATWSAVVASDLLQYEVEIREGTGAWIGGFNTNSLTHNWTVKANTLYSVRIRARDISGNVSPYSSVVSLTSDQDTIPPEAPTEINVSAGLQHVWITWTESTSSDVATYHIFESTDSTDPLSDAQATYTTPSSVFSRADAVAGTTYFYWVAAVDTSGNRSNWVSGGSATVPNFDGTVTREMIQGLIDATSFAAGIRPVEIVSTLPSTDNFEGRMVYLTTDDKMYRYNGTSWISAVAANDITGQLTDAQIQSLSATKVAGQLTDSQIASIAATKLTGQVVAAQIANGAIDATKFASDLAPVEIVNNLPSTDNFEGRTVYLTTDDKLYRHNGTSWISNVPASDVTGQLTDAQIASIAAAKLTGQITETQITDNAISTPKIAAGAINASKIAANTITASQIAANTITASQIAAGTITGDRIAAGAVTATQIAAGAVTAGKVAAAAISTTELAAGAVNASKIAAGTITSNEIASNTITAGNIAAGTITGDRIASNTITADHIAANAITASELAGGSVVAGKLASGSVLAENLTVAFGRNIVQNSDFSVEDANGYYANRGWNYGWNITGLTPNPLRSARIAHSSWVPLGMDGYVLNFGANPANGTVCDISYLPQGQPGGRSDFPVVAGKRYEFSAYLAPHRCNAFIGVVWLSASGAHVGENHGSAVSTSAENQPLSAYPRSIGFAVAPAQAATAALFIRHAFTGAVDPHGFGTGVYFGEALPNQTQPTPWSPAGVTAIHGDAITTGSIAANRIVANSITSGQIAAGAIGANQIAANAIRTKHLLVGDYTNMVPNGDMMDTTSPIGESWNIGGSGVTLSYADHPTAPNGKNVLVFTRNTLATPTFIESNYMPLSGAKDVYFEVTLRGLESSTAGLFIRLELYDVNGTSLPYFDLPNAENGPVPTSWTTYSRRYNIPSNARNFRVRIFNWIENTTTYTLFVNSVVVRKANAAQLIVDGSINANMLVTGSAVITQTAQMADTIITTAKIADANITTAKIANLAVTDAKIDTLNAAKVVISGSTTLANWRNGANNTLIEGGSIAANTISANKIEIGIRGITVEGVTFSYNKATNVLSWTTGVIRYTGNDGTNRDINVNAGSVTWTGGVQYVFWNKGTTDPANGTNTNLSTTTAIATANAANTLILAAYRGGVDLVQNYGRTIIDGTTIQTGTLSADRIVAKSIDTSQIAINGIRFDDILAGAVSTSSSAFTATGTSPALNTLTTIQSVTITPNTGAVVIMAFGEYYSSTNLTYTPSQLTEVSIYKGATKIGDIPAFGSVSETWVSTGGGSYRYGISGIFAGSVIDSSPGTSTVTYQLRVNVGSLPSKTIENRSLTVINLRK